MFLITSVKIESLFRLRIAYYKTKNGEKAIEQVYTTFYTIG